MKPRNRRQAEIVERWERHGLTKADVVPGTVRRWARRSVIHPQAVASGRKAWCTDCGHSFAYELPKGKGTHYAVCPHCGKRLLVTASRKKSLYENGFFQQLDIDGEFQIIRMYEWEYSAREGREAFVYFKHVYDLWLEEGLRKRWRFSVPMKMFYYKFHDPFGWGDLELRSDTSFYREDPARGWYIDGVYPHRKLQPWMEKLDIRPPYLGLDVYDLGLHLQSPTNETVWKLRHWNEELCAYYLKHGYKAERYFRQLCLAHKHGYKPSDPSMWFDHLEMLREEGRDICNPKVIFPADLAREHQALIERRERRRREEVRRMEERQKLQEERERLERENADSRTNRKYRKRYGKALGVVVVKGDIEIKPLQNVQDFYEQGRDLHQCVYGAKYYLRPGIICLCVRVGGVRTETVEVFLEGQGHIGQCRGIYNQDSPRHDEILALVNKTMNKFISAVTQHTA